MNSQASVRPLRPALLSILLVTLLTGISDAASISAADGMGSAPLSSSLAAIADPSPMLVGIALLGIGAYFRRRQ